MDYLSLEVLKNEALSIAVRGYWYQIFAYLSLSWRTDKELNDSFLFVELEISIDIKSMTERRSDKRKLAVKNYESS